MTEEQQSRFLRLLDVLILECRNRIGEHSSDVATEQYWKQRLGTLLEIQALWRECCAWVEVSA